MGLFGSKSSNAINWTNVTSAEQLRELIASSDQKAVAIFKHSTRCSISSMIKSRLEKNWQPDENVIPVYLDLLSYRPVSNLVEELSGVLHESPQMIVFKNGKPIYNASHGGIDPEDFTARINEVK